MDPDGTTQSPRETTNDPTPHLEPSHAPDTSPPEDNNVVVGGSTMHPQTSSAEQQDRNLSTEAHHTVSHTQSENFERSSAPRPARGHGRMDARRNAGLPAIPWDASGLIPVVEKSNAPLTVGERLQPTIENAVIERDKYARKVLLTGYALNIAIGLQVLLGALTTAISAVVTTTKQAQVSTAILGGLATLVASYLARARGSGEPDLSVLRVKDLEHFLRKARAFQLDHAHEYPDATNGLGERLEDLRHQFEELLGNASGARKLSPVGITSTQAVPV